MSSSGLSTDELETILNALDGAEATSDHPARRSDRVPCRPCTIIVRRNKVPDGLFLVVGRNISRHGLAFLHTQYFTCGEEIRVAILNRELGNRSEMNATVVRCRHITKMIHEIGVEFAVPLPDCTHLTADAACDL